MSEFEFEKNASAAWLEYRRKYRKQMEGEDRAGLVLYILIGFAMLAGLVAILASMGALR
jgi:fatty acid desaturase